MAIWKASLQIRGSFISSFWTFDDLKVSQTGEREEKIGRKSDILHHRHPLLLCAPWNLELGL